MCALWNFPVSNRRENAQFPVQLAQDWLDRTATNYKIWAGFERP